MANIPFLNNAYFAAKVGIGVPTPNESLEVSGSILLSSRLKLGTGDHYLQQTSGDIYSFTTGKNIMYAGSAEVFRVDEAKLATFKGNAYFNSGLITTVDSTGSFYIDVNANNDYGGRNFRVLNNGTTYFNINADGDVGIGTTNPSAKLEVFSTTTNKFVRFRADNNEQRFEFYVGASGNASRMSMHNDAATETIRFASAGNSYFNGGNVGIGTTSPGQKLSVTGTGRVFNATSTNDEVVASITRSGGSLSTLGFNGTGSTSDFHVRIGANATSFVAFTSNAERMRITSSGNVGIGTTSPAAKLHVIGNSYVQSGTFFTDGITSYTGTTLNLNAGSSYFNLTVNNAERMRVTSSGTVLINATTPRESVSKFSVQGGMSEFETTLTNNDDWQNSPISILERANIGSGSTADKYAPNLNFHWGGVTSKSLWMGANGHLSFGEYSSTGVPATNGTFKAGNLVAASAITGNTGAFTGQVTGPTPSTSTSFANKAYVDAHVSPAGTYLPLAGGTMTGNLRLNDNVQLFLGSQTDFVLAHNGTNSYISNYTGDLYIEQTTNDGNIYFKCDDGRLNKSNCINICIIVIHLYITYII